MKVRDWTKFCHYLWDLRPVTSFWTSVSSALTLKWSARITGFLSAVKYECVCPCICACMYVANIHCYTSSLFKGRATFVKKLIVHTKYVSAYCILLKLREWHLASFPVHRFVTNFRVRLSRKRTDAEVRQNGPETKLS